MARRGRARPAERRDPGAGGAGVRVIPVSVWRSAKALAGGGVAGLVPAVKGPQRASKLSPQVIARIRSWTGRAPARPRSPPRRGCRDPRSAACSPCARLRTASPQARTSQAPRHRGHGQRGGPELRGTDAGAGFAEPEVLPVLPDIGAQGRGRRWPGSGCWAREPRAAFTPGARYPLAGLLLALPPLAQSGLWPARGRTAAAGRGSRPGGHAGRAGAPGAAARGRAEGATGSRPRWAGCSAWTGARGSEDDPRELAELAAAGKADQLQMALARHHAAARPDAWGFL